MEKLYGEGGAKVLQEKTVRLPHCPPQIPTAMVCVTHAATLLTSASIGVLRSTDF